MTPLYLDGRTPLRVGLASGECLRIESQARSDRLVPLARVSRVVVSGAVDWDTAALRRLMRAGIPVAFLDARGEVEGFCLGTRLRPLTLAQRIGQWRERPDWPAMYQNWFRAAQRRAMQRAGLAICEEAPNPRAVRARLYAHWAELLGEGRARRLQAALHGEMTALACAWLHAAGLAPVPMVATSGEPSLLEGFTRLLEWDIQPPLAAQLNAAPPDRPLRYVAALLEGHSAALRARFAEHLHSLGTYLEQILP